MSTEQKPWGTTTPIYDDGYCHMDRIEVVAGGFSSRHLHKFKDNVFIVHRGSLLVTLFANEHDERGYEGQIVYPWDGPFLVEANVIHNFVCPSPAIVTEVYSLSFAEDEGMIDCDAIVRGIDRNDIVRFSKNGVRK